MDFNETAKHLLDQSLTVEDVVARFNTTELADFVTHLKEQVDANWWTDANVSLQYADAIIAIGKCSQNKQHLALGMMARGDTLRFLGELVQAWDNLTQAAEMFNEVGDEVGWARTCIGRLGLCTDLHRVDEALKNANQARAILLRHEELDLYLRLETGYAYVFLLQGKYQDAIKIMLPAIDLAESIGKEGKARLRFLYQNVAFALMFLTRFDEAKQFYDKAYRIFEETGETKGIALTRLNLAYLSEKRGHFREALNNLRLAMEVYRDNDSIHWAVSAQDMTRCYIELNRFEAAYELITEVETIYRQQQAMNLLARTLEILAALQAHYNDFEGAIQSLHEAVDLFQKQDANDRLPYIDLSLAQILYLHQQPDKAIDIAKKAADYFEAENFLYYCNALLIIGKVELEQGKLSQAQATARTILAHARRYGLAPLRYQAHLLLGKVAEAKADTRYAIRHYQAANATINRLQQRLTISLRSDFLLDKNDAFRRLLRILLAQGQIKAAFVELERHKSQVFWHYVLSQDSLRWKTDTPERQEQIAELENLRSAHHWYYNLLQYPEERGAQDMSDDDIRVEITQLEKQIRKVTEQVALDGGTGAAIQLSQLPTFDTIQSRVADDTLLIEYYVDDDTLYIFTLHQGELWLYHSPICMDVVRDTIDQLQFNIDSALTVGSASPLSQQLGRVATTHLCDLYDALLAPINQHIKLVSKLIIVPYGVLHYVPFHLLMTQDDYLFTIHTTTIVPSSSLLVRDIDPNTGEPLVLGYSRDTSVEAIPDEARRVHNMIEGKLKLGVDVKRDVLTKHRGKILHIAAHGEFRMDQPDLSYIELSDGQLMSDDLLQMDMAYALITLSACETGRAWVAPADELIGLGRGFLYSGAAALLTSLWRAEDEMTRAVMLVFYKHLRDGMDKAQALQQAYMTIRQQYPKQHVAFWGAFQLIGDASPVFENT